jgi:nucleoid-associated protein YgaU
MGLTKARITVENTGQRIDVQFNPEEYSLNKDNNFASQAIPGLSSPLLQFVHGNVRTLDMELFFDTTQDRTDVRNQSQQVVDLLKIVLVRANQKYTRFLEDGTPVRARVTVTFNEFIDADHEAKEVNRQTADFTKVYVVNAGDTLAGIAVKYYNDPLTWRPIAIANNIDDPRDIAPGQELTLPSLPYRDPATGEVVQ